MNKFFPWQNFPYKNIRSFLLTHFSLPFFLFTIQNSTSQSSSSEVDEGPAAKLARFTNDLIAENHQRKTLISTKRKLYDSSDCNLTDDDVSEGD